ncbi:MAG: hypothetical protein ABI877_08620 [Gemmatimonadaceae bacterium]
MRERAVTFGSNGGLVGVVTEPTQQVPAPRRAILLSNVGSHHRVGPFRLYVEVARFFATRGWYVLRFDLAGLGDSVTAEGAEPESERATLDVIEAMNFMEKSFGIEHFVPIGLCSGVDSTHAATVIDARIKGVVFIDGYTYPTFGYQVRRYLSRFFQLKRWLRYVKRKRMARHFPSIATEKPVEAVFTREYPSLERFRSDIGRIAARDTRMLFIFTGSVDYRYNHRNQIFEQLGDTAARHLVDIGYFSDVDHLFSTEARRRSLMSHVDSWLATFADDLKNETPARGPQDSSVTLRGASGKLTPRSSAAMRAPEKTGLGR